MNIIPLNKRVLVKRNAAEEISASGLYLPDSAKEKVPRGIIIALATECDLALEVGQTVLFHDRAGYKVELDDSKTEYLVLNEADLIGVIR